MAMMSMKGSKKMKGFMCHSQASTAICMTNDYRSVIVPRNQIRLVNNTKYIRLAKQPTDPEFSKSSSFHVSSLKKEQGNPKPQSAEDSKSLAISDTIFQVVVMRVSIHCQGCAGKIKKHISKMEGVTSFSVDLESKRVTVMGHVSPSGVLESISKVKKAEFWPC